MARTAAVAHSKRLDPDFECSHVRTEIPAVDVRSQSGHQNVSSVESCQKNIHFTALGLLIRSKIIKINV